jgi:hypothetical protein
MQPSEAQPDGQPQLVAGAQPSQPVMLRDDKRTAIVEMLGEGVPKVHAAAIAGVSEATLHAVGERGRKV